jgi:DNA polymerase
VSGLDLPPRATIDFETRSACSIKDSGSWRYSLDPSTEVLCLAFRLPSWEKGRTALWHPSFPHLDMEEAECPELEELFDWITRGELIEAHNAWFERGIWTNVILPRFGNRFPHIRHEQWRCSAAKAAAHSLPRSLEMLTAALRLDVKKDIEGSKLMKKLVKPRKPRKKEVAELEARGIDPATRVFYHESREQFERLFAYCRQDVLAEEAASEVLRDLSPLETKMFLMDQALNERGFQLDREAVEAALELIDDRFSELNAELIELTGGKVQKATQRAKMLDWLGEQGVWLNDTQGPTIDAALKDQSMPRQAQRGLELMRMLGRSSTAKYECMRDWASPVDWKVRGGLLYHGAGTGRWSGAGVQPHNFPRGNIKNQDKAWADIKAWVEHRDTEWLRTLWDDEMELLSHALRGAIVASPGKKLYVADYAAIEARVVFWLAEDQRALDIFRRGECIYCDMATDIYKRPIIKDQHPTERQMGKQAVLGLGYQMGAPKFVDTVAKYGIVLEESFAKVIVDTYREKYHRVKSMWWDQEAAAIKAVQHRGQTIPCGKVKWRYVGKFLYCRLPSGRMLAYCEPLVVERETPWGAKKPALTYMGVDPYTRKWRRQDTYGGMLVENITQAVARDLMAEAMLRMYEGGTYFPILSVHDEAIAEADDGTGDVREFELLMAELPEWAEGCPVKAEGWSGYRYRK